MEINWSIIACCVIGLFTLVGFFRGWWKEALTTIALAILVFFLQNPDLAHTFISYVNLFITTLWNLLPDFITTAISDFLLLIFNINTAGGPIQLDPSQPGTWVVILVMLVTVAALISRVSFVNQPNSLGKILGALVGALNGFLILSIIREYLDGRTLPGGQTVATSDVTFSGSSSFGQAASGVSLQATDLPTVTVMDSVMPWIVVGIGVLLAFAVIRTKVGIDTNKAGGRKLNYKKLPPFYSTPKKKKPATLDDVIKKIF